jgi:hypothetical protein
MPYKKISGIYSILNLINNKRYIGSAVSLNSRLKTHKHLLSGNKHFNSHLQSSWNKYGEDNFKFEIILECGLNELRDNEEFLIKKFNSNNVKYGYNKRINCETNLGVKFTDTHKKNLSFSHLGNKHSEFSKNKIRESRYVKVLQYDLDGIFLKEYKSMIEAGLDNNIEKNGISMCCRGLIKKSGGFIWKYK